MTREKAIDWGAASLFAHDRDICELAYLQGETWETFGKSYPKRKAEYMHKSERFLDALTAAGMVVVPREQYERLRFAAGLSDKDDGLVSIAGEAVSTLAAALSSTPKTFTAP